MKTNRGISQSDVREKAHKQEPAPSQAFATTPAIEEVSTTFDRKNHVTVFSTGGLALAFCDQKDGQWAVFQQDGEGTPHRVCSVQDEAAAQQIAHMLATTSDPNTAAEITIGAYSAAPELCVWDLKTFAHMAPVLDALTRRSDLTQSVSVGVAAAYGAELARECVAAGKPVDDAEAVVIARQVIRECSKRR